MGRGNTTKQATLSLATSTNKAVAPVVIEFQTSDLESYARYAGRQAKTQLMLRFRRQLGGESNTLEPHVVEVDSSENENRSIPPRSYGSDESVSEADMGQWVCGQLFLELWADDDNG